MRLGAATIAALLTVGMLTAPISTTFAADSRHRSHSFQHRAAAAGAHCVHGSGLPANPGRLHAGTGANLERAADRL